MRAFLLLCSLLGLSLAQNDYSLFLDKTGTLVTGDSATVNFAFSINGNNYGQLTISKFGAVFPGTSVPSGVTAASPVPSYSSISGYSVIGPMWSTAFSNTVPKTAGDNQITYSLHTMASDPSFFSQTNLPKANDQFHPTSAFVCTWYKMENSKGATVTFQLVILVDANMVTYAFNLYAEINWFSAGNFNPGFYADTNGAMASYNYQSPYAGLKKIQYINGKNGQPNFFYKLSVTPFVDVHPASASGTTYTFTTPQYIGVNFKPNADSHGATAFNFFSPANKGQAPNAFAVPSSYMYCYANNAYSGDPSQMSTSTYFAVSNLAKNNVWEFGSKYSFKSTTTYYCYADTTTNQALVTAGSKRSSTESYVGTSSGFTNANVAFAYQFATILFATVTGDPVFKSLRTGDSFIFGGEAGKHFNLYHDRYVNLNAEFDYAIAEKKEGTIISKAGVMVGGHKISFGAVDFASGSIQVNLDGKSIKLFNDKVHLSGCVDIHYLSQWRSFYIVSPTHKLKFTLDERHSDHLEGKFINIAVEDVPESKEDVESLGGVIGQTIKAGPIDTVAENFAVSGLFSVEKSNYKAAEFEDCA